MSADNGIYVLKTKDQYRVALLQNAEYMNYSIFEECHKDEIVPTRVVELWGDSKFTRKESIALHLAHYWAKGLPFCEYGVKLVEVNKTWKELMKDARAYARREINAIKKAGTEDYWGMELLQKVADGYYLAKWLHREQYNKDLREHDCGYWSVCDDRACPCAIDNNVNGFDDEVYSRWIHGEV